MMHARSFMAGWAAAACVAFAAVLACSPADRQTVRDVVPPLTRGACVVLRAVTNGKANEVCARAEDLLPFFEEILAAHEAARAKESAPARAELAFVLEEPRAPVARKKCLAWVEIGGADGGR